MHLRALTRRNRALVAFLLLAGGTLACGSLGRTSPRPAPADTSLLPDQAAVSAMSQALRNSLRQDTVIYFRFVNRQWARRVCQAFAGDATALPQVRLHGDAHLEQYAVTDSARGLDDFDDSAIGPSVVDLVRFLGSIDLALRRRHWTSALDTAVGAFLDGYRRGLRDPDYVPAEPAVVRRVRGKAPRDAAAFLAWAESLMAPLDESRAREVSDLLRQLEPTLRAASPELPDGFLALKKAGSFRMGVGSALTNKFLLRVEGPTPAPDDDRIIEAKELSQLEGIDCLTVPTFREVFRVIDGAHQIGRIHHELLAQAPRKPGFQAADRDWWVKSWQSSYAELALDDLASAGELTEVAHDVGAQLGSANLREAGPARQRDLRAAELAAITRLEPRIRRTARELVGQLLLAWRTFGAQPV